MAHDEGFMLAAIHLATEAARQGDVPVGAVLVLDDAIVGRGSNRTIRDADPTAHAELSAIRNAARVLGSARLAGCSLYSTLEPCAMCAGAAVWARVDRVVFGAWDDKAGMAGSVHDLLRNPRLNHRCEVLGGVLTAECAALLQGFFRARRSPD